MTWAGLGVYATDHVERSFGLEASEEEKEKVRVKVVRVDKGDIGGKS
jgi:hypothetical protein